MPTHARVLVVDTQYRGLVGGGRELGQSSELVFAQGLLVDLSEEQGAKELACVVRPFRLGLRVIGQPQ